MPRTTITDLLGWTVGGRERGYRPGPPRSRPRPVAVIAGVGTHRCVLLAIGPLGLPRNPVVWPWNLALILLVVALFARPETDRGVASRRCAAPRIPRPGGERLGPSPGSAPPLRAVAIGLVGVMPVAACAGAWDASLSWSLYSRPPRGDASRGRRPRAADAPLGAAHLVDRIPGLPPATGHLERRGAGRARLSGGARLPGHRPNALRGLHRQRGGPAGARPHAPLRAQGIHAPRAPRSIRLGVPPGRPGVRVAFQSRGPPSLA